MTMNQNQKMFFPWPDTLAGGWQRPGNAMSDILDAHVMRMQHFTEEMQRAYTDTYDKQMEVLTQTGERLSQSVQELLGSQGPAEIMSAESHIASAWLEGMAARSQQWLALGQKLQQCCTEFARASFEDLRQQGEDLSSEVEEKVADTASDATKQLKAVKSSAKHAA
ncbi:MAG TPA: phasin family protein [Dongiaceae bacterium]|nr:phasin family protein [Dongiaceae bacterium]